MTGGLAPGPAALRLVAAARHRRRARDGRFDRLRVQPEQLRIPAWVVYPKDDVFDLCDAVARAERALIRAGEQGEAARLAAAFEVLESGLSRQARTVVSRRTVRTRSPRS